MPPQPQRLTSFMDAGRSFRIVVAVDPFGSLEPTMELLRSFSPANVEFHLVYAFNASTHAHPIADLRRARLGLEVAGMGAAHVVERNDNATAIIEEALKCGADMIALGPRCPKAIIRELLDCSPVSVLVIHAAPRETHGLTAVLATDHTEYMSRCIPTLREMNPSGLQELVILTADPTSWFDATRYAERMLANRRLGVRLEPMCHSWSAVVLEGPPNDVIRGVMQERRADLLILGAPRIDSSRLRRTGQVLYDQAISGPHSTLVLRCLESAALIM
jgi:nucleotide-binding universal stress UspA family protein